MALTDTFVKQTKHSGRAVGDKHSDGGGLYLLVTAVGKYWRMNYRFVGKQKTLALGVYSAVSLADARRRREAARKLLAEDIDPSSAKREAKQAKADAEANTFESVAREWLKKTAAERSEATKSKITSWLVKDVFPYIGARPIASISPRDVLVTVRKMEARGAIESAHRVKQVCGQVFRYGVATGMVERDVTVDLRGALAVVATRHHSAITEPKKVGELMRSIYEYEGHMTTVAALKFISLVFVRPGEMRTAEWMEIDLDSAEWRIPREKMKMKTDHIVPLSTQAVVILKDLYLVNGHGRYVFPSMRTGERPLSDSTINAALRAMGYSQEVHTAHGFRAMARTIMDEVMEERVDLIEHQLAHAVKDSNGRAYNRTAHLPARREMMQRWADYLDKLRTGTQTLPV